MNLKKEGLFYFDAEWVPLASSLLELDLSNPKLHKAFIGQCDKWNNNSKDEGKEESSYEEYFKKKAHFYPELCKIVCISYGYYDKGLKIIKSLYGDDEKKLLSTAAELFTRVHTKGLILSGYAIKRFDMPFISKRMMTNSIPPPKNISFYGMKPWEISVFDLPEVWGQGNMQESFTSFEMACAALDIESSKGDLNGALVADAYFKGELERIKNYCEEDVKKTMELAEKLIELL